MSSIPRSLACLLRRQTQAPVKHILSPNIPIRAAQTEAAPSALKNTHPPPSFQRQHAPQPGTQTATAAPTQNTTDLTTHPIIQLLRQDPTLKETRPHLTMPANLRPSHFVAGTLSGGTKLTAIHVPIATHTVSNCGRKIVNRAAPKPRRDRLPHWPGHVRTSWVRAWRVLICHVR